MNRLWLVIPLACYLFSNSSSPGQDLHVANNGNDNNPGTPGKPFATLAHARDVVRQLRGKAADRPLHIILHGGEYVLNQPVRFDPEDSGTPGNPLIIEAAHNETPVLTSGAPIAGWHLASGDLPGIAKEAVGHVWVADVPKGWRFHFLYVDGKSMPVARWQKSSDWHSWPKPVAVGAVGPDGQKLTFPPGLLDGLPNNGDVEMNLMPVQYWNTLSVLRQIDPAAHTAYRQSKSPTTFWKDSFEFGNYNLQNALKFLTTPGEWCVDSAAGKVYYWPESGSPEQEKIIAPKAYRLVELVGDSEKKNLVHDVVIRGLTFEYTDRLPEDQWPDAWVKRQAELPDATLMMDGVENCTVEDCTFRDTGAYAIELQNYAQKNRIVRNEMDHLGCGGVLLQGYGPGTTDVNRDNLVTRNYIRYTASAGYMHSAAVTVYQSGKNEISFNWLDHLPYAGIVTIGTDFEYYGPGAPISGWDSYGSGEAMFGTRWAELPGGRQGKFTREEFWKYLHARNNWIHDNFIDDYMNTMNDGGGLYSFGCGLGNRWEANLLRRTAHHPSEQYDYALYMDAETDGATLKDNICWHNQEATINRGANTWANNIVSVGKPAGFDQRMIDIVTAARESGGWLTTPDAGDLTQVIISGTDHFTDKTSVSIGALPDGVIRYTLDGTKPSIASPSYTAPFTIDRTSTIRATVFSAAGDAIAAGEQRLRKVEPTPLKIGQWVPAADAIAFNGNPTLIGNNEIGFCDAGGAIKFGPYDIDATDAHAIELKVGVDPQYAGGTLGLHLDSSTGPEIGSIVFQSTGGFEKFAQQSLALKSGISGKHDLWFTIDRGHAVCNLRAFRLLDGATTAAAGK